MRSTRKTALAAAATAVVVGIAGLAAAAISNAHTMTVRLPDGSVEQIHYLGDKPPQVTFQSGSAAVPGFAAIADPFGPGSPFSDLERMSAIMERQSQALLQQMVSLPDVAWGSKGGLQTTDLGGLPAGVRSYSVVSTLSGNGVCTRSVHYRSFGDGKQPQVVTHTSGNCGVPQGADSTGVSAHTHRGSPLSLINVGYRPGEGPPNS
jgi:hypothetical protein